MPTQLISGDSTLEIEQTIDDILYAIKRLKGEKERVRAYAKRRRLKDKKDEKVKSPKEIIPKKRGRPAGSKNKKNDNSVLESKE